MGTQSTSELQLLLEKLAVEHKIPGATVAVLDGNHVTEAATGVINKNTGVEVTNNTLFQIASITKVYTATLVMQLVDEGRIKLDEPVRAYLPELKFGDQKATESITVRNLLCHTSGVAGDPDPMEVDTGRGDDAVRKYVASCAAMPQISAPGRMFSYTNVGFVVAGHLVEQVIGRTWDAALKERLLDPLGTQRTFTLPEEAMLRRAAVGHIDPTNSGELTPVPVWGMFRSGAPGGAIISTAAEVLSFARLHLDDGNTKDGTRVLSKKSVRAMQQPQVESPDKWFLYGLDACALGWMLFDWGGHRVIGHDGGGQGQQAFLRIFPQAPFAVSLLTNGYTGISLYRDLFTRLFSERVGIEVPDTPKSSDGVEFDPSLFTGSYERPMVRTQVEVQDGGLVASIDWGGARKQRQIPPIEREPLRPINKNSFLMRWPVADVDVPLVFFDFDESGRPRYFHSAGRANRRAG